MRRLLISTFIAATLPGLATAQDRPSLLDYFSVDVIVQRVLQSGVMMLRTQLDLKYSDMSIDIRTGAITFNDVVAWPLPEWDLDGNCEISVGKMTLRGGALDKPERACVKAQLINTSFHSDCLPEEPRQGLSMAGLTTVSMPRMTIDIDYGLPGSDATMRVFADIDDATAIDLTAEFAYIWFDGREDIEEPLPVVFLKSATLALENKGLWNTVRELMPPPFTTEGAGLVVEGAIGQGLLDLNSEAGGDAGDSLTDSQRAFVGSVRDVWPQFLASPETLVLQTNIDGDVFLDFELIEDDPREVFDATQPQMALKPNRASTVLPVDLLSKALGQDSNQMSVEDRKRVGIAMVTGVGAPRNFEEGFKLLNPIARLGDGDAAAVMSEALEARAPEDAYRWALLAGRAGETGAAARLDRLERNLSFQRILELQNDVSGDDQRPVSDT